MHEQLDDKIVESISNNPTINISDFNNPTIIISDFERIENKINSLSKEIDNIKRQRERDIWFLQRR